MSRIGKKTIEIPEKTEVVKNGPVVTVKGPNGEIEKSFKNNVEINIKDKVITFIPKNDTKATRSLWGTYSSHISNMINGVNTPFEKKLVVEGIGYKSEVRGNLLVLNVGFSHPVEVLIPEGLVVTAEKNAIKVSGIDKEAVGQFAAKVKTIKKPEPYKGKGIRYEDEVIRRKQGKKTA